MNDGSRDGSEEICRALAEHYDNVTLINFRRNFGKSAARPPASQSPAATSS